jgi:hypothetical protein
MAKSTKSIERILELDKKIDAYLGDRLTDEQEEEKWLCENSFYLFVQKAWPVIEGGQKLILGWHMEVVCQHLEALYKLEINRLIINLPPRLGKSNVCSVLFPAWVWTKNPALSFLYSSYASSLSIRDSVKCRILIESPWYQSLWGNSVRLSDDSNNKIRFDNTRSGFRMCSSVGGSATGFGANFEVSDDVNNVKQSESDAIRESTNNWHDYTMSTRYAGTFKEFRRLLVQQRVHEKDCTGNVLSKQDSRWIHLCLPMEFEKHRRCVTIPLRMTNGKKWRDPRTKEGELLWPAGINATELSNLKKKDFNNDSYRISGQFQQSPSPSGGGIIQAGWYKHWQEKEMPRFEYILQSWDTALVGGKGKSSNTSAYSACTTWGIFNDNNDNKNIMLISLFKGRVEYPELRKMAIRLAKNYYDTDLEDPMGSGYNYPADLVLIEAKVSGYSLASDLMRTNIPIMRFNPNTVGDKVARARRVTDLIENGLVWLPCDPPSFHPNEYAQVLLRDSTLFPNGESNDTIDSMSQAFIRLKQTGWVYNTDDYKPVREFNWKNYENENYHS